ncbi:DMT family transporter [Aestuariibacter sp. A3R04]|uniref:DMT family transporter n=1 Tax=Aestuariibacter sp. A3R04 TaxID=2841571 RepID=UPI001C096D47|nr:DMT family transporter [Aestuariibacter sp. A3R04]MBU3020458.1 DMT family transporter [Aestuariibacter sp. A3R04]
MTSKDIFSLALLGAIWGGSFIFMRVAAPEFGVFALVEIRAVLATAIMLPFLIAVGGWRNIKRYWWQIGFIGALNTAIPFVLFNYSSLHLEAGVNAILNATAPMFGALVAFLWLKDTLKPSAVTGLFLGFIGVIVLSAHKVGSGHVSVVPILTACMATLCYGIAACAMKRWLAGVKPIVVATGSQIFASLILLPFSLATLPATMPSGLAWLNAIALAVLGTGIAYILYFNLIATIGPAKAISVGYLVPLFGIIWGLLFLNESLSVQTLTGGVLILLGVALTTGVIQRLWRTRTAE